MKIKKITFFLVVCELIFLTVAGQAQGLEKPMKISFGSYQGYASFSYEVKGRDTMLNGPFQFTGPILDVFDTDNRNFFSFSGGFLNNKPVDYWLFTLTNVKQFNKTILQDDNLHINVDVLKHTMRGDIGNESTNWRHEIYLKSDQQSIDTLWTSTITSSNDGSFLNIKTTEHDLKAQTNDANLADNTWQWLHKKDTSVLYWKFNAGILTEVIQNGIELIIDDEQSLQRVSKISTLPLSEKSIEILKIKLNIAGLKESCRLPFSIISKLDSIETIREDLFKTVKGQYDEPLLFKLPYFELNRKEKISLKKIVEYEIAMDSIFKSVSNIDDLEGFKKGFPEVVPFLDSVQFIYSNQYYPLKEMSDIFNEDLLPYFNRDLLADYLIKKKENSALAHHDSIYKFPVLIKYGQNAVDKLKRINKEVVFYLDKRDELQELVALEKKMLSEKVVFDSALDSALNLLPDNYYKSLYAIRQFGDSLIDKYWSTSSSLEKIVQAQKNANCFDQLFHLCETLSALPSEKNNIITAYTDSSFNVFTSTNIEYLRKKKIIAAYTQTLIPYFFDVIKNDISYENISQIQALIINTNRRMLQLKKENTKYIENNLNPKSSAKEVFELFEISAAL